MKEMYEMRGEGVSIRGIARELGVSHNRQEYLTPTTRGASGEGEVAAGIEAGSLQGTYRPAAE